MFKSYLICCFCVRSRSQECKHILIHLIYFTELFAPANQVLFAGACRQLHVYLRRRLKCNFNKHSANRSKQQLSGRHLLKSFFASSSGSQLSQWDPVHKGGRVPIMATFQGFHILSFLYNVREPDHGASFSRTEETWEMDRATENTAPCWTTCATAELALSLTSKIPFVCDSSTMLCINAEEFL